MVAITLLVHLNVVQAEEYRNVEVQKLLVSSTAINGDKLQYLRTDHPEVTALIVHIPPGGSTGWHKHPVPVYAYILEGKLTLKLKDGRTFSLNKGAAIFEVMNIMHNGYNFGKEPVSLVVFYTGAVDVPKVVMEQPDLVFPALP